MAVRLSENMAALKEYARRQEMFVGNFDHELKTPLTSIIGYADMLRSKRMTGGADGSFGKSDFSGRETSAGDVRKTYAAYGFEAAGF